jgi:hypothetical protein
MTRKAIIETATGAIVNIIEIEADADWACPVGFELRDMGENNKARIGGTWDGSQFIAPVIPDPPRLDVLIAEGPATEVYNDETEAMVVRPAADIAADKAELLNLLHAKLTASGDLTWDEMNKMLALERES